jgi:gluconate 2-dehydrogenase gamma chain
MQRDAANDVPGETLLRKAQLRHAAIRCNCNDRTEKECCGMADTLRRRAVLLAGASLLAVYAATRTQARTLTGGVPWTPGAGDAPTATVDGAWRFFTPDEAAFIDAAVARLIPADDLGPGAREAGVTVFLDRQLAGPYGQAETWYMSGPWHDGTKSQGYESQLTPAALYRTAIKAIDDHCRQAFGGKTFSALSPDQQDSMLTDLEKGKFKIEGVGPHPIEIEGAKEDSFFSILMQNTLEGFFSDPMYGGNRDMIGWKLIGFPGAHYDYRPYVKQHGTKLAIEPVGLRGRPGWTPNQG